MIDVEEIRAHEDRRRTQEKSFTPPQQGRAQPTVQDGRYGFGDNIESSESSYQDDRRQPQYGRRGGGRVGSDRGSDRHSGLVSDSLIGRNDRYDGYRGSGRNFRR